MSIGLIGKKSGMTRVFTEDGVSIPVTVISVLNNQIAQIKTQDKDGYAAIQVAFGKKSKSKFNKAMAGHYAKAGVEPAGGLREFRIDEQEVNNFSVGGGLSVSIFTVGQYVDVEGITKGKGFAGTIKRHHFNSQDATHGNSLSHRVPGSIGQRQTPGRVFPGKKMSGHLGDVKRTAVKQEIVQIDEEKNLILIKGAIPGSIGGTVVILPTVKKNKQKTGEGK